MTTVCILSLAGHYMYIETSSPRRPGDVARLVSQAFNPVSASGRCISFWYNMYGRTIDTLKVLVLAQGIDTFVVLLYMGHMP